MVQEACVKQKAMVASYFFKESKTVYSGPVKEERHIPWKMF